MNSKLQEAIDKIVNEFTVDKDFLCKATKQFLTDMDEGLKRDSAGREYMPMIPAYVTKIPSGKEKGLYLAADLGGTNFRVCSITLKGDHTFTIEQEKARIPDDLMKQSTAEELFAYLAKKVKVFLDEHHGDLGEDTDKLKLGFTFSFPVDQTSINRGKLIRWTKGFDLPDCVGKDIVELFQQELDKISARVHIAALANDTVGTLLSRAYSNNPKVTNANTVIGCIFGTGTNGAYFEAVDKIPKLGKDQIPEGATRMAINTEWGSFDNTLKILPSSKYDEQIDAETSNKGYHLFEKRISGMFLGELVRIILVDLFKQGFIFQDLYAQRGGSLPHRLAEAWQLSSEVLSYLQIDDSTDLKMSGLILENNLRLPTTKEERLVIQTITQTVTTRAARLSAIPLAAIVSRASEQYIDDEKDFEVGCDGSVVEFYPGFQDKIKEAISLIDPLMGSKKKVHLRIAKDGSGVGAALAASVAH